MKWVIYILILILVFNSSCKDTADEIDRKVDELKNGKNQSLNTTNSTQTQTIGKIKVASLDIDSLNYDNSNEHIINTYNNLFDNYHIFAIQNYKGGKDLLYELTYNTNFQYVKENDFVFLYDERYIKWIGKRTYNDGYKNKPFGINFKIKGKEYYFTIIQVLLDKYDATQEIKNLENVYNYFHDEFNNNKIFILGNMYADCYYYNTNELKDFYWIIKDEDTITTKENCNYDRIITTENMRRNIADYGVDDYIKKNNINKNLKNILSTHYPVFFILNI